MRRRRMAAWGLAVLVTTSGPVQAAMTTEERLRALERLVNQQQQEIQQLRGELKQQKAIGTATQQQAERAEEQAKATEKKAVAAVPKWVDKFTPFGDIRIRHEGFYNQPTSKDGGTKVVAQNRERYRWRLGVKYAYSDELSGTIRLASGNPDDPISTNETFNGDFSRKNVNLDWAFLTVAPGQTFGLRPGILTLNAGKFPNPMFRPGELVFDDDLSPEGFNQTVQALDQPIGPIDQVKIHAQQWTFNEVSNAQDGWMFGGQINPVAHFGDVQLEGGLAQYWWLNPNLIAQQGNSNSSIAKSIGQNLLVKTTNGSSTTIDGFVSGFNQTNLSLAATVPITDKVPFKVWGDYVHNWQAETADAEGVQGGVRIGQTKEQGDIAGSVLYEYLQRDAVIGAFSWSDFGGSGGTNQQGPVVALEYQLFNPLTLTARSYFTKYISPPANVNNRTAVRLQLDAQLKF